MRKKRSSSHLSPVENQAKKSPDLNATTQSSAVGPIAGTSDGASFIQGDLSQIEAENELGLGQNQNSGNFQRLQMNMLSSEPPSLCNFMGSSASSIDSADESSGAELDRVLPPTNQANGRHAASSSSGGNVGRHSHYGDKPMSGHNPHYHHHAAYPSSHTTGQMGYMPMQDQHGMPQGCFNRMFPLQHNHHHHHHPSQSHHHNPQRSGRSQRPPQRPQEVQRPPPRSSWYKMPRCPRAHSEEQSTSMYRSNNQHESIDGRHNLPSSCGRLQAWHSSSQSTGSDASHHVANSTTERLPSCQRTNPIVMEAHSTSGEDEVEVVSVVPSRR